MADLTALVRLHQHELDEKRRELKDLYDELEQIELQKQAILDNAEKEKQLISSSKDMVHFTYAEFQGKTEQDCAKLVINITAVEQKIYIARDEMLEIFGEMKRYDMAQKSRERIEEQERKLRETKTLDEIALEGFRRNELES